MTSCRCCLGHQVTKQLCVETQKHPDRSCMLTYPMVLSAERNCYCKNVLDHSSILITWQDHTFLLSHLKLVCLQQRVKTDSLLLQCLFRPSECSLLNIQITLCFPLLLSVQQQVQQNTLFENWGAAPQFKISRRSTWNRYRTWVWLFLFQELVISRWCSCRESRFSCRPTPTTRRSLLHWPQPGVSMKSVVSRFSWVKKQTVQVRDWL